MRKFILMAALAVATFATASALPNRADAMTFSTPAGVLSAAGVADVAPPEQVRWCGWRGCWGGVYFAPRSYYRPYAYYGYYQPYYRPYWNYGAYAYYGYYQPYYRPYWGW